ncbi:MAG: hypothetical protein AAB439_00255 [Patescibacteria group bacterium]
MNQVLEIGAHWRPRDIEHEGEAASRRLYHIFAILAPILVVIGAVAFGLQKEN